MYFSQNVSHLLSKTRWTRADLAREIKISPSQVKRYLDEGQQPKIEIAVAMAQAFSVNLDDLILVDLSKNEPRPFGAMGEDQSPMEETLLRMNELLEQRLKQLEEEIKKADPARAEELGIK